MSYKRVIYNEYGEPLGMETVRDEDERDYDRGDDYEDEDYGCDDCEEEDDE